MKQAEIQGQDRGEYRDWLHRRFQPNPTINRHDRRRIRKRIENSLAGIVERPYRYEFYLQLSVLGGTIRQFIRRWPPW